MISERIRNGMLCGIFAAAFCVLPARAATLIVSDGELTGATGVIVEGASYDVTFAEGSCNSLFNGCTSFTFNTLSSAVAASQSLLDQVFLDGPHGNFDSLPDLTFGVDGGARRGDIFTPYGLTPTGNGALIGVARNGSTDLTLDGIESVSADTLSNPLSVYAVWSPSVSPIPEPEIYAMLGLGLGMMGWVGRRKKLQAAA